MSQNFNNHKRFSPPYHFFTVPLILTGLGFAVYAFVKTPDLTHGLIVLAFMLIGIIGLFARFFSLRVQDRAARADERLRYYILTGKMLPATLRMGQILALRFASDEEFPALVDQALAEQLSPTDIKKAIKNWRGDYHRI
ncbi:DUF6526 family protein [Pedobacter sp. KR3-3]|uniref:DUF6526 family protein n=1 Tax=Pedobacter albus TaxID=3113905 RepID=A0ABU7I3V0_9SPHI|nr:DUF6526 family protein [Pedobacter sp. KR3-3]MEE1944148.1 DUF6526 family protein [Pedobacter sp. KR3-3]